MPQVKRIEFRIGIHVGDIIVDDNDIFGDGVNIAARLEGIAERVAFASLTTHNFRSAGRSISPLRIWVQTPVPAQRKRPCSD
jgi:class 3 adenylate cyclase